MTSQINPNNINGAYPVAGQDNNSQGFRDNFTNTSTNFEYAASEITDLQNKAILKAALTGTTLSNDMLGSPLSNALLSDMALASVQLGVLSGNIPINYVTGQVYTVETGGNISLVFTNWPDAGNYGWVTVEITVSNPAYTVTFPTAVSVNTNGVQGLDTSTNIMTFAAAGVYTFTFSTVDNGTTITLTESNNSLMPLNHSGETLANGAAASLAVTSGKSSATGAWTATLAAGVEGQMKIFVLLAGSTGSLAVTVASPGWGGAGTATLSNPGDACTLRYTQGNWYCVGNNGAVFA